MLVQLKVVTLAIHRLHPGYRYRAFIVRIIILILCCLFYIFGRLLERRNQITDLKVNPEWLKPATNVISMQP